MNPPLNRSHCLLICTMVLCASSSVAQNNHTNYGQAYQQMVRSRPDMTYGTSQYLYNKYYRNNVAVSPYLSGAILGGTDSGTAYTSVVRGDVQRREAALRSQAQYVQQRKAMGNVGYTVNPGGGYLGSMSSGYKPTPAPPSRTNGAYQNHWYGGWKR